MSPEKSPLSAQDRVQARRDLGAALDELNLSVSALQLDGLLELAESLHVWGARINLTGHKTFAAVLQGLVVESAALASELPELETLADLGAGAGFPGLPIAILRPTCRVTLVEARERRHHFQRSVVRQLGLENASPQRGRAEALTPVPHSAAIAQAMASPERALAWMKPWVREGGWILIPGGSAPPSITPQRGIEIEAPIHYRVPGSQRERTLWVGRVSD